MWCIIVDLASAYTPCEHTLFQPPQALISCNLGQSLSVLVSPKLDWVPILVVLIPKARAKNIVALNSRILEYLLRPYIDWYAEVLDIVHELFRDIDWWHRYVVVECTALICWFALELLCFWACFLLWTCQLPVVVVLVAHDGSIHRANRGWIVVIGVGLPLLYISLGRLHCIIRSVGHFSVELDSATQGDAWLRSHREFKLVGLPAIVSSLARFIDQSRGLERPVF